MISPEPNVTAVERAVVVGTPLATFTQEPVHAAWAMPPGDSKMAYQADGQLVPPGLMAVPEADWVNLRPNPVVVSVPETDATDTASV
jgi:hypothetical protein